MKFDLCLTFSIFLGCSVCLFIYSLMISMLLDLFNVNRLLVFVVQFCLSFSIHHLGFDYFKIIPRSLKFEINLTKFLSSILIPIVLHNLISDNFGSIISILCLSLFMRIAFEIMVR